MFRFKILQVFVKDLFKDHAGWPLNNMERSYKFMLKHVQLWKVAFHSTSPRWVHNSYLAALAAFYATYGLSVLLVVVKFGTVIHTEGDTEPFQMSYI